MFKSKTTAYHSLQIIKIMTIVVFSLLFLTFCKLNKKPVNEEMRSQIFVTAQAETKPVPRDPTNDAADDPAIWINFSDPDSSHIIGTDKKGGLAIYDLSGHELFYYNTGKMNNVDLRYDFPLISDTIDIMAVSNRTDQSVDLFKINHKGYLDTLNKIKLQSKLNEVYGLCMYKSKVTGKFYVFVNGLDFNTEQWELFTNNNHINGKIVRNIQLGSQVEGMVADDENGLLYISEEDKGIWKFSAEPGETKPSELLKYSTVGANPNIVSDLEGLTIYKQSNDTGYLIASSQGNSSYAVFDRTTPNKYLGSFKIVNGSNTDGTDETDGLDVTSYPLGKMFPKGLLVVQDGINFDNGIRAAQNFKLIRWDSIAVKFNPPLEF
jgi:3-phytase (myo-inositol-hexaphosphate 3-phosphohydrolase)